MILGTVVGVAQTNVKRMLAYSSIAHAGYLLVGLVAANDAGKAAILFYLVAYARHEPRRVRRARRCSARTIGQHDDLRDFAGLWHERPGLAALLTVFLLSLGGFPPTVGFIGSGTSSTPPCRQGTTALADLGVLTSVVSVFFYLRIVVMMYMTEGDARPRGRACRPPAVAGLVLATLARVLPRLCCRRLIIDSPRNRSRRFSERLKTARGASCRLQPRWRGERIVIGIVERADH